MRRKIWAALTTLAIALWATSASAAFIDSTPQGISGMGGFQQCETPAEPDSQCADAAPGRAGGASSWARRLSHYIKTGYRRNVDWPYPFICPDRAAVREPFEVMIRNGWRRQNLLGAHFFNPATNQLTTAGELQVRWIMTQAPPQYRQVFIERAIDPTITADRIAATRSYAARVSLDGQMPDVFETNLIADGRPAAIVDATNVKSMENMPVPMLPANSTIEQ